MSVGVIRQWCLGCRRSLREIREWMTDRSRMVSSFTRRMESINSNGCWKG
ncbi:MAG TPA: DUF1289 domain-containing protein, partial [Marinobacter sp.]|nr:DUF1289 domain-containing protein [Marinobacter sp.]